MRDTLSHASSCRYANAGLLLLLFGNFLLRRGLLFRDFLLGHFLLRCFLSHNILLGEDTETNRPYACSKCSSIRIVEKSKWRFAAGRKKFYAPRWRTTPAGTLKGVRQGTARASQSAPTIDRRSEKIPPGGETGILISAIKILTILQQRGISRAP